MADAGELYGFRAEVRACIAELFPPRLKGLGAQLDASVVEAPEIAADREAWRIAMGQLGWGVPTWPKAYGAAGLSGEEAGVIRSELARAGAYNPIGGMGVMMFGPTLLEYGDEAQKAEHIPHIVTAERRWCQGFSEPSAGSDLASLNTRCEDKGDHWLLNGQKIWTSGANYADWCFALVRTDSSRKHEGISFIIFDMTTPGVEVRPIQLISGSSPFCETFLTDVVVPKENLVGPLNGGWTIGKRLLQHERSGIAGLPGGGAGSTQATLADIARTYIGVDAAGRIADPDLRARIAANGIDAKAFQLTAARVAAETAVSGPTSGSSILKNAGTRVGQERGELVVEIMGARGLGWDGEGFAEDELAAVRQWLGGKATTIYGGSQEVQNNIIAKRILGLPDPTSHG